MAARSWAVPVARGAGLPRQVCEPGRSKALGAMRLAQPERVAAGGWQAAERAGFPPLQAAPAGVVQPKAAQPGRLGRSQAGRFLPG